MRPARALAMVAMVALLAGAACSPSPSVSPSPSSTVVPVADVSAEPSAVPAPGHEVFGFVPYWEMDAGIADHVAGTPLTTLALFSVTNTTRGRIKTGSPGYRSITGDVGRNLIRTAHQHGMRVELVFSSFGAARNTRLFTSPDVQAAVVDALVTFSAELGVDGIDVDVEGLDADLVPAYGEFVGALRDALRAAAPEAAISVATPANALGAAMARAASDAGADRILMMAYDYHSAGSSPGATTPLARRDGSARDLPWSIELYAALGVPVERTILGLPLYGYVWPVAAPVPGGPVIGAPSIGRGDAWIPRRHLDLLTDPAAVPLHDDVELVEVYLLASDGTIGLPSSPPSSSPSAATQSGSAGTPAQSAGAGTPSGGAATGAPGMPGTPGMQDPGPSWEAVYVDSPSTLAGKMQLALSHGYAGVGFWAIGYERGLPGFTDVMRRFADGRPLQ